MKFLRSLLFFYFLCGIAILIWACNQNRRQSQMFSGYNSDTLLSSFFRLYFDSVRYDTGQRNYYQFILLLDGGWKSMHGYVRMVDDSILYMNNAGTTYLLSRGEHESPESQLVKINLQIAIGDSTNFYENYVQEFQVFSLGNLFVRDDTIRRIKISNFSHKVPGDHLLLYFSRKFGILGSSILLSDSVILGFQGRIFSDSNIILSKSGRSLL